MKNLILVLFACFVSLAAFAATPSIDDAFAQGNRVFVDAEEQLWVELEPGRWATRLQDGITKTVAVNKEGYAAMVAELEQEMRIAEQQYAELQSKKAGEVMELLQTRLGAVLADMETVAEEGSIESYVNRTSKTDCLFDVHVDAGASCSSAYASVDVFTHHCEFVGFVRLQLRNSWGASLCNIYETAQGSRINLYRSCSGFAESSFAVARAYRVDDTSVSYIAVDREFCGIIDRR